MTITIDAMDKALWEDKHQLPDTARKSLSHARTLQHVHGTFMTSALGKKEARFITTSTIITAVTVWWLWHKHVKVHLSTGYSPHSRENRSDQHFINVVSLQFSEFQHTQLQQQKVRLSWKNKSMWISRTRTSRYWQNMVISQPSLDQHPLADTCTKQNDTCVSSENVFGGFAQTLTSHL